MADRPVRPRKIFKGVRKLYSDPEAIEAGIKAHAKAAKEAEGRGDGVYAALHRQEVKALGKRHNKLFYPGKKSK